ncbi:MAG: 23S rRNA (pseudouridine(1915)-N(3))-methyltransferase RlmH [Gammaproteobacteria bacterium]|nr:23S rRNA (pseudouridine(1915)-N(3))-methyltransferase RlmH [Gammaproteobacteria bacterium]
MHIRLIAVGDRQPAWVDDAFRNYSVRFPQQWKFRLDSIAMARRPKQGTAAGAKESEGEQILAKIKADERTVLLDERGKQLTSRALAKRLATWQTDGRDLCFIIGGPDGVPAACRERADFVLSLSSLTLPHGLARVLLAEQLFRVWSMQSGHPYHRD